MATLCFGKEQTSQFPRIFWISGTGNFQHRMFFSFLDLLLMFLGKSEAILPFSVLN